MTPFGDPGAPQPGDRGHGQRIREVGLRREDAAPSRTQPGDLEVGQRQPHPHAAATAHAHHRNAPHGRAQGLTRRPRRTARQQLRRPTPRIGVGRRHTAPAPLDCRRRRLQVFLCDPHAPWQRGTARTPTACSGSTSPEGFYFSTVTEPGLDSVADQLNARLPSASPHSPRPLRIVQGWSADCRVGRQSRSATGLGGRRRCTGAITLRGFHEGTTRACALRESERWPERGPGRRATALLMERALHRRRIVAVRGCARVGAW